MDGTYSWDYYSLSTHLNLDPYICIYIYAHAKNVYISTCIYTNEYIYIYVSIHLSINRSTYPFFHLCVYTSICKSTSIYIYIKSKCIHMHKCIHMYLSYTNRCVYIYIYTCIYTRIFTYMYVYTKLNKSTHR